MPARSVPKVRLPLAASLAWSICILASVAARAIEVGEISVEYREDRYHLAGESVIAAPGEFIFDSLIDFDNFHLLAEGVANTHFMTVDGEQLGYTRVDTCILFFCRAVEKVERLDTRGKAVIEAEALPELSHYRISKTRWQLEPVDGGTRVIYTAEISPDFWLPRAIGAWAIRRTLRKSAENIGVNIEYLYRRNLTLKQYAQLQNLNPTPKLR